MTVTPAQKTMCVTTAVVLPALKKVALPVSAIPGIVRAEPASRTSLTSVLSAMTMTPVRKMGSAMTLEIVIPAPMSVVPLDSARLLIV